MMGVLGGGSNNMSQIVGTMGSLQKVQLDEIDAIVDRVLANGYSVADLEAAINDAVKASMSGISPQQAKAIAAMVRAKLASRKAAHGAKAGGSAKAAASGNVLKLQELLKPQQQLNKQISELMKVVHKDKTGIINNLK